MHPLAEIFARYLDSGEKHSFRLKNGNQYLGWGMPEYDQTGMEVDYDADYILWLHAQSPIDWSDDNEFHEIKMDDVDLGTLEYWVGEWKKFAPESIAANLPCRDDAT